MKFHIIIYFTICTLSNAVAQCLKGNCDDGIGTYQYNRGNLRVYSGEFKDGLPNGNGVLKYDFGVIIDGYFKNGEINTEKESKVSYDNGYELAGFITEIIDGQSISWELNGLGTKKSLLVSGDFRIYHGNFIKNVLNDDNGEIRFENGNIYVGGVVEGKRQGVGKIITPDGGVQQDGNWFNDIWVDANDYNPNAVPIYYDGGSIEVDVDFSGTKIRMTLDTGASVTLLNKYYFYSLLALGQVRILDKSEGLFAVASGEAISGKIYVLQGVKIGNYEIDYIEFSVIDEENAPNLLGLNALLKPSNSFYIDVLKKELSFW